MKIMKKSEYISMVIGLDEQLEYIKDFKEQIKLMQENKISTWDVIQVRKDTPKVLQDLGFQNLPMLITQSHIKKIIGNRKGNHDVPIETLIKIPQALDFPRYILKSKTDAESVVIVTSLLDKIKNPIIVSIKKDGKGIFNSVEIKSNFITSIYGKEKFNNFVNSSEILYKK